MSAQLLLFAPLFTVSVEHSYFADGMWRGLTFVPCTTTAALARGAGVLFKATANGVGALCEAGRPQALQMYANDAGGTLPFLFKVYAGDRAFANYTMPPVRNGNAILCFRNPQNGGDPSGVGSTAAEKAYTDIGELAAKGFFTERDRRVPPDFLVEIHAPVGSDGAEKAKRDFRIEFGARQSFWKYHLLGKMNRSNARIVDLDGKVEFEPCGEVVLPGNRPSRVFRSRERIPVLEKSPYRFQLRELDQGIERVLVKRLSVASDARLGLDVIEGSREVVLENYVNF